MHISNHIENRLREIAQRCPLDDGMGVHIARSTLLKIDTLPKHYISECERVPSPEDISAKRNIEENIGYGFNAYPNPTNAGLTVNYVLEEGQNGRLTMMDISGRIIRTITLNTGKSTIELQLNGVAEGLYILHVDVEGQTKLSERITVIRP
ncbi:MAG: T9SS type A sorting domain-containing protein [Flavobacteriales bacterium]|nr:T9SS type A sorting domain-containing protein [Flavobacteriales bacterium]